MDKAIQENSGAAVAGGTGAWAARVPNPLVFSLHVSYYFISAVVVSILVGLWVPNRKIEGKEFA